MINPLINHVRNLKVVRTYIKVRFEAVTGGDGNQDEQYGLSTCGPHGRVPCI